MFPQLLLFFFFDLKAMTGTALTTTGATDLWLASASGHADVVKWLLDQSGNPNQPRITDGATPVFIAAQHGHAECLKVLLGHRGVDASKTDTNGTTPIEAAEKGAHSKCVEILSAHVASIAP